MQTAFRALLTSASGVASRAPASRIVWGQLPQGTALPAISLHVIGNTMGLTQQGPDGLWQGRVQADCYGSTYAAAKGLADAVIGLLNGYRGGGFRLIILDSQRDYDETGAANRPHRVSLDFLTHWRAG